MAKPNNRSMKKTSPAAGKRTSQAQSSARAALRAQQAAQRQAARRRRIIIVVVGVVLVALIVTLVVVLANRGKQSPLAPGTTPNPTTPATLPAGQIVPPNADPNQGWIEIKADNVRADAPTLDIHFDYQCPGCAMIEQPYGPLFESLAESGDIIYRGHIRTFVGSMIIKNDSSERAAVAASCADTVGAFLQYNQVVFNNQPKEGVGYTDQQLRADFATQAGISGDNLTQFQACYDNQKTLTFVQTMESNNWNSTTINFNVAQSSPVRATPTLFVNGKPFDTSLLFGNDGKPTATTPDALLAIMQTVATS